MRTFACGDVLHGAYDPTSARLAFADDGHVHVHDASGTRLVSWPTDGDVESLVWGAAGRWVVATTALCAHAVVWNGTDGSVVARLAARGEILAVSPCGRWVALEDGIVDLDDLDVHRITASAAAFDAASNSFVLADADRVWRVAVSG